jgi:hypothetical protein
MPDFTATFKGPINGALWKRFRRYLRSTGGTATTAAIAVYVGAAAEPNLSGTWHPATGLEYGDARWAVDINHVGRKLTAHRIDDGRRRVIAHYVGDRRYEGTIYLYSPPASEAERIAQCGPDYGGVSNTFVAEVSDDFDRMTITYQGDNDENNDCISDATFDVAMTLLRQ